MMRPTYHEDQKVKFFSWGALLLCVSLVVIGLDSPGFASDPLLRSIRFEKSPAFDKALFRLNGFYPPEVFGLTGNQPRIVCDFKKTTLEKSLSRSMETNGVFVQRIRVAIYPPPDPKIRVVLDLDPQKNYTVDQTFFQKDTTFVLIIRPENADKK